MSIADTLLEMNAENNAQAAKIAEALSLLDGKAAGGSGGDEVWEKIGETTVTEDDNVGAIAVSADFTQYKKLRVMCEYEASGTGNSAAWFNNYNASAFLVTPTINQKFGVHDFIIYKNDILGCVETVGFHPGSTWAQFKIFSNNGYGANNYTEILQYNATVLSEWDKLSRVTISKYNVTFVNARMIVLGVRK